MEHEEQSKQEESTQPDTTTQHDPAQKAEEYLAGWQRAKADYANLKKEMDDERRKAMFYAKVIMLADLLPVISNFQKATESLEAHKSANGNSWAEGFVHIAKQFSSFLEDKGVKRIPTDNVVFDPSVHEALEHEQQEGVSPGTVIREVEPGYTLNDEVIVPAKVIVAK